jgi:PAS domain S-box-containing protein
MISYKIINKERIQSYESEISRLNKIILNAAGFISEIEKGNLEVDYTNDTHDDALRAALLSMKEQLKKISEQEKNQTWTNKGLAIFADFIRAQYVSVNDFSDKLISNLVKYLQANQGGIFILKGENEKDFILEMSAGYAYDKKKHHQKTIRPGQGLLGQAFLEKETIFITELPDQYTTITSGLGAATPDCVLIVPLKYNEEVVGVLEIASFKKIETFEIEFIEKIAQSIASAISSMRTNERTEKLLYETREQAENLRSQEEEMRQNLEELQTTQEKSESMERELRVNKDMLEQKLREHELESERMLQYMENYKKILIEVLDEIPQKIFLKDEQGKFILVNTAVANAHNLSIEQLLNTSDFDYFNKDEAAEYRQQELEIINGGKPVIFYHEENISGKKKVLKTMKRPIYLSHLDQSGGLLGIQTDVSEIKKLEEQLKEKEKELSDLKKMLNV